MSDWTFLPLSLSLSIQGILWGVSTCVFAVSEGVFDIRQLWVVNTVWCYRVRPLGASDCRGGKTSTCLSPFHAWVRTHTFIQTRYTPSDPRHHLYPLMISHTPRSFLFVYFSVAFELALWIGELCFKTVPDVCHVTICLDKACHLQLPVIERCIWLLSNNGLKFTFNITVLSNFNLLL